MAKGEGNLREIDHLVGELAAARARESERVRE